MHKTFFLLQLLLSLAAGRDFLQWKVPKQRRVVLINLEIQAHHYHKRSISVTQAEGITPHELGDRFHVINCRGLGVEGPEGVSIIEQVVENLHPEIIAFDPLYKIASGTENDIESGKIILNAFDGLIQRTGAAVAFVHHDAKGSPGDRDIRDRGAGSNVLGRDYDACFTLTPHATDYSAVVIETILRNYRPQEPIVAVWVEDDPVIGCYHFEERRDIVPEKKTSKTRTPATALPAYLPAAISILGGTSMEMGPFKAALKQKTGLSDNRIRDFINWATAGGNPSLSTQEERGRGHFKKVIGVTGGELHE